MTPQLTEEQDVVGGGDTGHGSAKGQEILYEGQLYDVTSWVKHHPGGNIIRFYTQPGEDATIPIQQFHNRSMNRVLSIMKRLPKRNLVQEEWGHLSPETLKRHKALTKDFHALEKELKEEGFFEPNLAHTIYRFVELFALLFIGLWCASSSNPGIKVVGMCFSAMFAGRCGWLMHEGGHHSITGIPKVDRFIQSFVYGFGAGMSALWWSSQHNRHHAMPQRLHRDVDLDTLPLLAFNKAVLGSRGHGQNQSSGQTFFIRHQSKLFILIDTWLVALFWKFYLHPRYAWKKGGYSDLFFMLLHYSIALRFGVLLYFGSTWLTSVYIFLNFSLSHTHLPVTTGGEHLHWLEYALFHTVDIERGRWGWVDWWMCFLNYQIEHHLFPSMPQFRQSEVRPRIEALAKKHNLPFHTLSYWGAIKKTFENLDQVACEVNEDCNKNL